MYVVLLTISLVALGSLGLYVVFGKKPENEIEPEDRDYDIRGDKK